MDKRQRIALLGVAAAIAAVAVVIALVSGGGDNGSSTTQASDTQQTQQDTTQPPDVGSTPIKPEKQPTKPSPVRIEVKGGQPVDGLKKISVKKNDTVEIDVVADGADDAHLHGYNIEKPLTPGKTARFRFKATLEGVFELELHHSGAQLARVTVKP
jgi:uncharacterized cupredoxin-like copper-binding protein